MPEVRIKEASPLTVSVVVDDQIVAVMTIPQVDSADSEYWVILEQAAHPWKARVEGNNAATLLPEPSSTSN
jgi:hypothetical protein